MTKEIIIKVQREITRFFPGKEERGKILITDERLVPFIGKIVEVEMKIAVVGDVQIKKEA